MNKLNSVDPAVNRTLGIDKAEVGALSEVALLAAADRAIANRPWPSGIRHGARRRRAAGPAGA